jgi:hypothetical protein
MGLHQTTCAVATRVGHGRGVLPCVRSAVKELGLPRDASDATEVRLRLTVIEYMRDMGQYAKAAECFRRLGPEVERRVTDRRLVYECRRSWAMAVMADFEGRRQAGGQTLGNGLSRRFAMLQSWACDERWPGRAAKAHDKADTVIGLSYSFRCVNGCN